MFDGYLTEARFDDELVRVLLGVQEGELGSSAPGSTGVALPAAGEFEPPHGAFLVAVDGGAAVGCGAVRLLEPRIGELQRLYVAPPFRRGGAGRMLLTALEGRAVVLGCERLRLDTDGRGPALALFRAEGYEPIADYNGNPHARFWFEKQLTASVDRPRTVFTNPRGEPLPRTDGGPDAGSA